jgi:signal transduction histidine kinase
MRAAPEWWRALGGKWCVSIWSGIVGAGFVIPSTIWTTLYSPLTLAEAASAEATAAVISLLFLWWAHSWWLSPSRAGTRHRSWLAVLTFAVIGLIRLAALFAVRGVLGIDQPWSPLGSLVTGGVYSIVMLSLVAVVVDSVRQHALTMGELEQARESIARATAVEADDVEGMQRRYVDGLLEQVSEAVRALRSVDDGQQIAQEIQSASDRIVRAGSHSLHDGVAVAEAFAAPRRPIRLGQALAGVRPSAPVLGAIAFECLVFTAMVRDFGVQIAFLIFAMAIPLAAAGSLLLGAIAKRHWPRRGRLPLLFACYLVVGAAATAMVELVLLWMGEPQVLWIGAFSFALFMTVLSVAPSMRRAQIESEGELATAVSELAIELVRVRSLAEEQRRQYAHLMHGGVQAEMTAAALAISRAAEAGESTEAILARADELVALLEQQRETLDSAESAETLADVIDTWQLALDIDVSIDAQADALMSRNPELARRVVDVVSEGLTNAVRHASARTVTLTISSVGIAGVEVEVSHRGVLVAGVTGQGSAVLDAACEQWSRTTDGARVTLECRLASRAMTAA